MTYIAIIAPSNLPIPSVRGGAIETLIDHFINENERFKHFHLTIFSNYDKYAQHKSLSYRNATFCYIKAPQKAKNTLLNRSLKKLFNYSIPSPYQKKMVKLLKAKPYDLIIIEGNEKLIEPISKHIPKEKIWFHAHANAFSFYDKAIAKAMRNCGKIISVSNFVKWEILKNYEVSKSKIEVIRNCVDFKIFKDSTTLTGTSRKAKVKEEFNISPQETVLLYVGRIIPEKGIKELIEAFGIIQHQLPVKLIIGGSFGHSFGYAGTKNKFYYEIQESIKTFRNKVVFTGFIPNNELHTLFSITDIAVVPSQCDEAAPLSVIESRVAGIPLITSDSGGIPEYVNEYCGIIIKRGKDFTKNLTIAIKELIKDENKRAKFKEYNQLNIDDFSTERYYIEFSNLIKKEING